MSDIKLTMSMSPHVHTSRSTAKIMWAVVIALVPALAMGVVVFGPRALVLVVVAVVTAVVAEFLAEGLLNQRTSYLQLKGSSVFDGSAALTGLLLAFNIPAAVPVWQLILGTVFAIVVGKMVFGGLGQNMFNPALAGRAFMMASFPTAMTTFPKPFAWLEGWDAVSAATSLGAAKEAVGRGFTLDILRDQGLLMGHSDLFLGLTGGAIGEVSALALLIGGLLLILGRVIGAESPLGFLLGLATITGIFWLAAPETYLDPLYHVISGGAILAAFFMVTDMVTSPMTPLGRLVYAFTTGLLTGVIRLFGGYPEGASYAILIMNALVPVFDTLFPPRKFGSAMVGDTGKEKA